MLSVIQKYKIMNRICKMSSCFQRHPPHVEQVGEDDIWRLRAIETFFEDSEGDIRESIYSQVNETARYSRNFRLVIQKYLSAVMRFTEFDLILEKVMIEQ